MMRWADDVELVRITRATPHGRDHPGAEAPTGGYFHGFLFFTGPASQVYACRMHDALNKLMALVPPPTEPVYGETTF
jgi:hypothetical protein